MSRFDLFQQLVRQPSVFEHEHGAIAIVERALYEMDIDYVAVPFDPQLLRGLPGAQPPFSNIGDRRNIVARLPGRSAGRSLIINCHLDVAPASDPEAWSYDPFSGVIRDGIIFGRGSYDDKAGVAICLSALARLRSENSLRGKVTAHFVLEDEITGNGSLLCLNAGFGGDGAIIIDGTRGDRGINQHAGNIRFAVTMTGKPASVSVSHMGVNAAEMLNELLIEIRRTILSLNKNRPDPWSIFPSPNQFSIVGQACEETSLTVPSLAHATCYATFTPPHDLASFRRLVEDTAHDFVKRHKLQEEPIFDWSRFATEPVRSDSAELEAAIIRSAGRNISFGPSTGTSDMRHFVKYGIPCVLYGPGTGHNPHRADECFHLNSIEPMVEVIYRTAIEWCS
jgi:acetylornithine deacetylase